MKTVCRSTILVVQFLLASFIFTFVISPDFSPQTAIAAPGSWESSPALRRKYRVQQRLAARWLQRAQDKIQEQEEQGVVLTQEEEEQQEAAVAALAACAGPAGRTFSCTDRNGKPIVVGAATGCDTCKGANGGQCLACCDKLAGGTRAQLCKQVECNA